jgi:hypothetical protein
MPYLLGIQAGHQPFLEHVYSNAGGNLGSGHVVTHHKTDITDM